MTKEVLHVPGVSEGTAAHKVPLSAMIRANGFIFGSGMPPYDETGAFPGGDIVAQTERVMENIRKALESNGSSLDKVVKTTIYITNAAWFSKVNTVYARYFPTDPPARTFVTVGSWPAEFDVEIEFVALA